MFEGLVTAPIFYFLGGLQLWFEARCKISLRKIYRDTENSELRVQGKIFCLNIVAGIGALGIGFILLVCLVQLIWGVFTGHGFLGD